MYTIVRGAVKERGETIGFAMLAGMQPEPSASSDAIELFRRHAGAVAVSLDAATLAHWGRSTAPHSAQPGAVAQPRNTAEVVQLVQAASEAGVSLYPVSRGKNWGYGDATPTTDGSVIVDLSGMNRVLELNAKQGYAVVEPGVTQGQLAALVAQDAPDFWVDCTGAGPDASVLGNALERGFGHTPYGDHVRTMCNMECVLADGTVMRTGMGHYAGAHAAPVYPYGVGPFLDGMFTQSNLAIVTAMTVWLCPKPEAFRFFYIKVERDDALPELIEALRPMRLQGILNSAVHIGNDLRVMSGQRRYPHERAQGVRPLPVALREALRQEARIGAWSVSGSLTGTAPQVKAAAARLKRAVGPLGRVLVVGDRQLALARQLARMLAPLGIGSGLRRLLDDLEPHVGLLKGAPTSLPLRGALWGVDRDNDDPMDPLEVGAGLIWLAPVLPIDGAHAAAVRAISEPLLAKHGFDFMITFTLLNERAMVAVMNIAYDQSNPTQGARAEACYQETVSALMCAGYPPYRASIGGMPMLWQDGDAFWETARKIKHSLDPQGILAPGRYIGG